MGLVDYSDSDASNGEEKVVTAKPTPVAPKGSFRKVVDRSNPGKIRVSLPQTTTNEEIKSEGPLRKRLKTGGNGLSGLNAFLPAPKRTSQSQGAGNAIRKGDLGPGVSLKTGAEPGFSREPVEERETQSSSNFDTEGGNGLRRTSSLAPNDVDTVQKPADDVKLVGKPLMFRPLSVARKPAKKRKVIPPPSSTETAIASGAASVLEDSSVIGASNKKVSLFSMAVEPTDTNTVESTGNYQPFMEGTLNAREKDEEDYPSLADPTYDDSNAYSVSTTYNVNTVNDSSQHAAAATPQSLDDIAADLNLTAAARRQLFGRQKGGPTSRGFNNMTAATTPSSAARRIISFNTDQEYRHNEKLRAAGEQVQHNPVRAIAPGKHSLQQLVKAAANQKDALEESFAKGKNNRAEASSRYGW